jgi:hypothetical protein
LIAEKRKEAYNKLPSSAKSSEFFIGGATKYKISWDDIDYYLDDEFYRMFNIWNMTNRGFGLPGYGRSTSLPWDAQPTHIMTIIELFEAEYKTLTKGAQDGNHSRPTSNSSRR